MVSPVSSVVIFPAVVAVISHYIFNRHEPNALHFVLGLLGYAQISSLVQWARGCYIIDAIYNSAAFLGIYLLMLSLSISFYRLGPWHPLAKYPGPRLAHLTKWWMVNQVVFRGGRHAKLQQSVLSTLRYLDSLTDDPSGSMKKMVRGSGSTRIAQLVEILKKKSTNGRTIPLDYWIYLFFLDTMGDIGFSGGFESMKTEKDTEGWLLHSMGQIPWLKDIVNILPRRGPIDSFHRSIEKKIYQVGDSNSARGKRLDILGFLLDSSSEAKLTPGEVIADAALIVVSATDTSVQAVVTIFRYLGLDRDRQSRLRDEVNSVLSNIVDDDGDSLASAIARLPFLDACVQESLRIVPPGPFGPLRTTGGSGAFVCGEHIPLNTTIHVPVYAMHRDPAHFGPLAGKFIPERWMDEDPVRQALASDLPPIDRTSFMPFGAGFGSCIGKNLAIQNVKLLVAHLVHNFEVSCASDFDVDTFDQSYKEFGIWQHNALPVTLVERQT
ncbi:Cytochrome P450 [Mycena sanguinolenta]|uniref:Cytochrome P450 n=1 Tax=Mycena sanguinolenta TaxID=230812 RepID=A0A8H6Z0D8_9AGAR|nr:Cytochrome P450 [Mycena sanguinolenta]